jgi:hypothetical protein
MANYITRNHQEEFVAAAKEEAGLAPMGSMETMECEAMVQDANLLIKQFNLVCTHVMHATGISQLQDGIPRPRIEGTGRQ